MMLALVLAAAVGIALGVLGGGGSILAVPIFVYGLGFDPKLAVAMSLAVVGVTSAVGAVGHWRAGNVNVRIAAIFGVVAMAGTFAGARLAALLTGPVQLMLFALVMLAAAYSMMRSRPEPEAGSVAAAPHLPVWHIVLEGAGVGVVTGLVGVGGGFLVVPALVALGKVPMRQAIGTSLVVIALKSLAGFAGYIDQFAIPWSTLAVFTGAASAAIIAGTWLAKYVPQQQLRHAFVVLLVGMSMYILWQNREVLLPATAEAAATSGQQR